MATSDPRPCYVYVLWGEGTTHIKIGHAYDVESRKAALQTGSPYRLRTLMAISLPNAIEASDTEKRLHDRFSAIQMAGEWFNLPQETPKALEILAQITGVCRAWERPKVFVGIPPRSMSASEYYIEDILRILQRASRQLTIEDILEYTQTYWYTDSGGRIWNVLDHLVRYGRIQKLSNRYWYDVLLDTSDVPLHPKPDWFYPMRSPYLLPKSHEMTHEQIDLEIDEFFRKREDPFV